MAAELKTQVQWIGGSTSLASGRTHSVTVDRPAEKGGSDLGFAGGELFVAGLGGCYMSNLTAAAQARNIRIDSARLRARGVLAENPTRIVEFILEVELDADCDEKTVDKLLLIAERSCLVSTTVKQGTQLTIRRVESLE